MKQRYFTKEHLDKIYNWIDAHRNDPCALMLDVLSTTGCRCDELMRIQFRDINRHEQTITIQRGSKGSESRTRKLSSELINALFDAMTFKGLDVNDFISDIMVAKENNLNCRKTMFRRYFIALRHHLFPNESVAGLHGFRHSKAVIVYGLTKDIYAVKMALGHKTIASTEHYLTFINEDKLKDVFSKRG